MWLQLPLQPQGELKESLQTCCHMGADAGRAPSGIACLGLYGPRPSFQMQDISRLTRVMIGLCTMTTTEKEEAPSDLRCDASAATQEDCRIRLHMRDKHLLPRTDL